MPWRVSTDVSIREEFVLMASAEEANIRRLCSRFGISPTTGYKWLRRWIESGCKKDALEEMPRIPKHSPNRTAAEIEQLVVALREEHPGWGGRKLRARLLAKGQKPETLPSASTITSILRRCGLLSLEESEKREHYLSFEHPRPNDLWQIDFKGDIPLERAGVRCHPLTVLDDHSRFAVGLVACANERSETTKEALTGIFRRYGLPFRMTMDNGSPWGHITNSSSENCDAGVARYTLLELWLFRLGIRVSHSRPYHPQTQGKDERFHRTLKLELLRDYSWRDVADCQPSFDRWRDVYNCERPHEALGMAVPASRYCVSGRPFPERLPELEYDAGDEVRKVNARGMVKYRKSQYFLGHAFKGEYVVLRPQQQADGVWDIYYGQQKVATLNFNKVSTMSPNTCP
jgi:transposase InsO family protein